jgi:hypothetical protein
MTREGVGCVFDLCCRLLWYKEPTPEPVGDLDKHLVGKVEVRLSCLLPLPLINHGAVASSRLSQSCAVYGSCLLQQRGASSSSTARVWLHSMSVISHVSCLMSPAPILALDKPLNLTASIWRVFVHIGPDSAHQLPRHPLTVNAGPCQPHANDDFCTGLHYVVSRSTS